MKIIIFFTYVIAKGGHLYITLEPKTMSFPAMKTIHLIVQKQFNPFTLQLCNSNSSGKWGKK